MNKGIFSIALFSALFSVSAFGSVEYAVTECSYSDAGNPGLKYVLSIARQNRDQDGNFIKSGTLKASIKYFETPTTIGRIDAEGESTMTWSKSSSGGIVAEGTDGSFYAQKSVSEGAFKDKIANIPELAGKELNLQTPAYNPIQLTIVEIKVNDPLVASFRVTLQQVEHDPSAHLQVEALRAPRGGYIPLAQLGNTCDFKIVNIP